MDIKKKIDEIVDKVKNDKDFEKNSRIILYRRLRA